MPIPVIPVSWGYRLRMAGVLVCLVLLQAAYLALIAAVAAMGVFYAIGVGGLLLGQHFGLYSLLLTLIPPAALALTVVFLLKPLIVRQSRPLQPLAVDPGSEPVLFAYLEALCAKVGAPAPRRVFVDMNVNAAAAVAGWPGFFLGRVHLTIGLPLVTGLTLPQFTGVLAHEFGHFAQTLGLRSHFLIGQILGWFNRVAHQRDAWDDWLERQSERSDWRARALFALAAGVVTGSRWVLARLLQAGVWVSAGFSRQMEFDADRYEAAVVGPAVFASTTRELPVLMVAAQVAWQHTDEVWAAGSLPRSFPALVAASRAQIAAESVEALVAGAMEEEAGRWSTHPAARDRIAHVERHAVPHFFPLEGTPERLFVDLPGLAERATNHHLEQTLGAGIAGVERRDAMAVAEEALERAAGVDAVRRVLGAIPAFCAVWLEPAGPEPRDVAAERPAEAPDYAPDDYSEERRTHDLRFAALHFQQFGIPTSAEAFRYRSGLAPALAEQLRASEEKLDEIFAGYRAAAAPTLAWLESVAARATEPEMRETWGAWAALTPAWAEFREIRRLWGAVALVEENAKVIPEATMEAMRDVLHGRIVEHGRAVAAALGEPAAADAEGVYPLTRLLRARTEAAIAGLVQGAEAAAGS